MKDGYCWAVDCNPKAKNLEWERTKMFRPPRKCDWISDIKFSPDDKRVAIGSHNNKIYIYKCGKWKKP